MKKVYVKISNFLNNIIEDWFDLEDAFIGLYSDVSLIDFCNLKAEFDAVHLNEED